jgi:Na+-transporting methylmalonyl-CoA/oxaloacetate decarboxylase gamma subunit
VVKVAIAFLFLLAMAMPGIAVPLETEVPEEVLRGELTVGARSPIDGAPLTAREYAELQVEIERSNEVEAVAPEKLRNLVGLLRLRKFIKTVLPFVPIK